MKQNIFNKKAENGFILQAVFFIFIGILILSFLDFDLKNFMESDIVVKNLNYIKEVILNLWSSYLQPVYEWVLNLFGPTIFKLINQLPGKMG